MLCANFGQERGAGILACKGAWHGKKCYRQAENVVFPVLEAKDLDDSMLATDLAADDPERFKLARDGDHLMCPFKCDDCHLESEEARARSVGYRWRFIVVYPSRESGRVVGKRTRDCA